MKTAPQHIAIIMDGNGRWAQNRRHDRFWGHIRGAQVAQKIVETAASIKIKNLTLFAFSSENWKRPEREVTFLMKLLSRQLRRETKGLIKNNIRFKYIGDISKLPDVARTEVENAVRESAHCTGMTLTFALSYGGRQELTSAIQTIAADCKSGEIDPADINEEMISSKLHSSFLPDPDLVIRTSGEQRISNFFLWQMAYTEFIFTEKLWPDYKAQDFLDAVSSYLCRERRFGLTPEQVKKKINQVEL